MKTRIMVIRGEYRDQEEFTIMEVTLKPASSYIYLACPFTENDSIHSVIGLHVKSRAADLNKFKFFCKMNSQMRSQYKRQYVKQKSCEVFCMDVDAG